MWCYIRMMNKYATPFSFFKNTCSPWVFFTFLKLSKWCQIKQSVTWSILTRVFMLNKCLRLKENPSIKKAAFKLDYLNSQIARTFSKMWINEQYIFFKQKLFFSSCQFFCPKSHNIYLKRYFVQWSVIFI